MEVLIIAVLCLEGLDVKNVVGNLGDQLFVMAHTLITSEFLFPYPDPTPRALLLEMV